MRRWSELAEQIAATSRTSEKVRRVADYLRTLTPAELPHAVVFLAARPFPETDGRSVGLGWAAIGATTEDLADADAGAIGAAYNQSSDLGQAVHDVLLASRRRASAEPPTLTDVAAAFGAIAETRGSGAKAELFKTLLWRCDPLSAKYLVKILSGELRIGLREGHLEAAIAAAFERELAAVQWAGMLTGDIGRTAELARDDRLAEAELTLFRPLKSMLASPAADATEVLKRLGAPVWIEDKYDGIRSQLHKRGDEVRLYSRDLHDVSGQFPEVVEGARQLPWDGILDGELLAFREGGALPFQMLQARLGRKKPPADLLASVPVIFVAFDLLGFGQGSADAALTGAETGSGRVEPLLRLPLRERRDRLDALQLTEREGFGVSNLITASTTQELDTVFDGARERGNEGLMVKDPDSIYSPGRRGFGWLKLKRPLATLDCVVVGVEVGHGKRHGVLSDYTFAVRDDRPDAEGRLVTIGKAYSGLTGAELAEMTAWFKEHTLQEFGRYRLVEPTVVVEVAFDVIMRSGRHNSGFALRFPRIARIRTDKGPADADTLSTVQALHERLQGGPIEYAIAT
ncbi:MAG: ATP-dependent DNA ligase [Chloroflexi bacterium]|nr:ATP-dependent DNA ligase [Chloroflexota bacterium]